MNRLTILVATSSASDYLGISRAIGSDPDFRLLPKVKGLMETFDVVEHRLPNIVIIDRSLTLRNEFELMRALFETHDVRWLVWDPSQGQTGARTAGVHQTGGDLFVLDACVPDQTLASHLRAIGHRPRRGVVASGPSPVRRTAAHRGTILIGASTGGVDALIAVLSDFPADCPSTIVVQHTGRRFGASLVSLLDHRCRAEVVQCADGMELCPGRIYMAAGTAGHAVLTGPGCQRIQIIDDGQVNGHMPSVDRLFTSAVPIAKAVTAAVLTGMGNDGANGLLQLRQAGSRTFAQDQETSVVYGMPKVAWETGAAEKQLAINDIGPALLASTKTLVRG